MTRVKNNFRYIWKNMKNKIKKKMQYEQLYNFHKPLIFELYFLILKWRKFQAMNFWLCENDIFFSYKINSFFSYFIFLLLFFGNCRAFHDASSRKFCFSNNAKWWKIGFKLRPFIMTNLLHFTAWGISLFFIFFSNISKTVFDPMSNMLF